MASKYRNVVRAVLNAQWAILPEKLNAICELVNLRNRGEKLSKSEIQARIGGGKKSSDPFAQAGQVAVLNIFGVICHHVGSMEEASGGVSSEAIGTAFDAALGDPNISAIVLRCDSPGGVVAGTPELAARIYAARGKKPVIAVVDTLAASAMYWLCSAAERVVISPTGSAGSIGVLTVVMDDTQAMEQAGIKQTVISAGKYKAEGYGPLTEGAIADIQRRVDDIYSMFVGDVAKHRGTSAAKVLADYGQGRMLSAKDALAVGMVDRIATYEQVLSELGVGITAATGRTDAPAFSLEGIAMNPKLFGALVRIGMCAISATAVEAENALDRFYAVKGKPKPSEVAAQIVDLEAHIAAMPTQTTPTTTTLASVVAPLQPLTIQGAATDLTASDRADDILAAVRLAGLPDGMTFASELIRDKKLDLSAALRKIDEKAATLRQPVGASAVQHSAAEQDKFRAEAQSALLNRQFAGAVPARIYSNASQGYIDYKPVAFSGALKSLPRLAEECLIRDGFNASAVRNLTKAQIAQIAMGVLDPRNAGLRADSGPYNTTGTFQNLLLDAAHVTLRRSYEEVQTTFQVWAKRAEDITDFKDVNRVIGGELSDPRVVPEGGEFEETTMLDGREKYALRVWGEVFRISFQAIVNDQLGAFTEIPRKQAKAMRRKQNRLVYGVLKDNANLADGGALFNATAVSSAGGHANLVTGAATPTVATLNAMAVAMAKQRGINADSAPLGLVMKFILAGAALGPTIFELLGSQSYVGSNVNAAVKNIWYNALTPVIDEELGASGGGSDTQFIGAASNDQVDTVEYAFLDGMDAPQLDSMSEFDRLGWKFRMYQPFATKAIDFRGLQKNAGA